MTYVRQRQLHDSGMSATAPSAKPTHTLTERSVWAVGKLYDFLPAIDVAPDI